MIFRKNLVHWFRKIRMANFQLILTRTKIFKWLSKRLQEMTTCPRLRPPLWVSLPSMKENSLKYSAQRWQKNQSNLTLNKWVLKAQIRKLEIMIVLFQRSQSKSVVLPRTFSHHKWTFALSMIPVRSIDSTMRRQNLSTSTGSKITRINTLIQSKERS